MSREPLRLQEELSELLDRDSGARMRDDLTLSRQQDDSEITVRIVGEIDLSNVARVLAAGREALSSTHDQVLVLDLREVTFIDSAGMGACVSLLKAARTGQRNAHILLQAPNVVRTFFIMGLMTAFDVRVS